MEGDNEINTSALIARCMGDRNFAAKLLLKLPNQGTKLLGDLERSIDAADRPAVAQAAHALRGMALNLSIARLTASALKMEQLALHSGTPDLSAAAAELRNDLECCLAAIPETVTRLAA